MKKKKKNIAKKFGGVIFLVSLLYNNSTMFL